MFLLHIFSLLLLLLGFLFTSFFLQQKTPTPLYFIRKVSTFCFFSQLCILDYRLKLRFLFDFMEKSGFLSSISNFVDFIVYLICLFCRVAIRKSESSNLLITKVVFLFQFQCDFDKNGFNILHCSILWKFSYKSMLISAGNFICSHHKKDRLFQALPTLCCRGMSQPLSIDFSYFILDLYDYSAVLMPLLSIPCFIMLLPSRCW